MSLELEDTEDDEDEVLPEREHFLAETLNHGAILARLIELYSGMYN